MGLNKDNRDKTSWKFQKMVRGVVHALGEFSSKHQPQATEQRWGRHSPGPRRRPNSSRQHRGVLSLSTHAPPSGQSTGPVHSQRWLPSPSLQQGRHNALAGGVQQSLPQLHFHRLIAKVRLHVRNSVMKTLHQGDRKGA